MVTPPPTPEPQPPPAPLPGPTPPVEDVGTQALSEALRSSFNLIRLIMIALVIAFLASGVFTVNPNEVVVKLRFGKPVGTTRDEQLLQPGLHWKLPYPIDDIVRIPVGETRTITSKAGWYAQTPEQETAGIDPPATSFLQPGIDSYTLSADGNIIHVRAILSYRIEDPLAYEFGFASPTNLLSDLLDHALIHASTRFTADEALYSRKFAFQEAVLARMNEAIRELDLGVTIDPREVRTRPPLYVEQAFDNVLRAQQKADQTILEAQSYARSVTNRAIGEASAVVQNGVTRSNLLIRTLAADATNVAGLLPAYQRDPELLTKRLQAQTVQRILTNAQFKTFLPTRPDGRPRELRLLLNKEPEVPTRGNPGSTQE